MLVEPERTPYDLRFRVLRFPVRVHPWFWLFTILMGASTLDRGAEYLFAWVLAVFVSILVHELGHALAYRRYGTESEVVLYAFGGLAIPWSQISGRWRRIIVYLAGPFAGFALAGLVYGSHLLTDWGGVGSPVVVGYLYRILIFINLIWGAINLLPIFPLDGGQVSRELCGRFWGPRGKRISLKISFGSALAVVAYSLFCVMDRTDLGAGLTAKLPDWFPVGTVWTAILFGVLAYQSYVLLNQTGWEDTHWDDRTPYDR